MKPPLVYVLVINWNGLEHLRECFDTLLAQTYADARFLLIDNASSDGTVRVWDAARNVQTAYRPEHIDWLVALDWSGSQIQSKTLNDTLHTWAADTGALLSVEPFSAVILDAPEISPDGTRRITINPDGQVVVLDATSGDPLAVLPGLANAAVWDRDGLQLAIALRNGTIKVWAAP